MFRQLKIKTLVILLASATAAYADPVVTASINNQKQVVTASAPAAQLTPPQLTVKSTALTAADNDANQLQEINRKQAIKDAMNKYNAPSGNTTDKNSAMGQTTATSIVINEDGYKAATLQFVDGSTLDVEPGTKIGKYVVDGISMTGVTLHEINCRHKKCGTKLIKRAYPRKPVTTNMPQNTSYQSTPTPVVNDTNNGQEQVPPIINVK